MIKMSLHLTEHSLHNGYEKLAKTIIFIFIDRIVRYLGRQLVCCLFLGSKIQPNSLSLQQIQRDNMSLLDMASQCSSSSCTGSNSRPDSEGNLSSCLHQAWVECDRRDTRSDRGQQGNTY